MSNSSPLPHLWNNARLPWCRRCGILRTTYQLKKTGCVPPPSTPPFGDVAHLRIVTAPVTVGPGEKRAA